MRTFRMHLIVDSFNFCKRWSMQHFPLFKFPCFTRLSGRNEPPCHYLSPNNMRGMCYADHRVHGMDFFVNQLPDFEAIVWFFEWFKYIFVCIIFDSNCSFELVLWISVVLSLNLSFSRLSYAFKNSFIW